ncbi:MAG TPA: hypothetical protein VEI50_08850 [Nitrospiraceae bacterium]|nr:hypothetical protein [Nitrospiraceae bacterium]
MNEDMPAPNSPQSPAEAFEPPGGGLLPRPLPRHEVKVHVHIIGYAYAAFGAVLLLSAITLYLFLESKRQAWFRSPGDLLIMLGRLMSGQLVLLGSFMAISGLKLIQLRSWALTTVRIFSIFSLFLFPLGTLWGAYCFWVFHSRNTKTVFAEQRF